MTGEEGSGKTTFAFHLLAMIRNKLGVSSRPVYVDMRGRYPGTALKVVSWLFSEHSRLMSALQDVQAMYQIIHQVDHKQSCRIGAAGLRGRRGEVRRLLFAFLIFMKLFSS